MPGSFVGGSGERDVKVGKREMGRHVERAQGVETAKIEFSSPAGEKAFRESGLRVDQLGSPTGKGGKYTKRDITDRVKELE